MNTDTMNTNEPTPGTSTEADIISKYIGADTPICINSLIRYQKKPRWLRVLFCYRLMDRKSASGALELEKALFGN